MMIILAYKSKDNATVERELTDILSEDMHQLDCEIQVHSTVQPYAPGLCSLSAII